MKNERRTVLINGAGIAGLTTALALAQTDNRVMVFEQAEGFELVGAGIQISPNALDVLSSLGLGRRVKEMAFAPSGIRLNDGMTGQLLSIIPLGQEYKTRFGHPYLVIHRSDLQNVLHAACREHPEISIQFAQSIVDLAPHANGVTALVQSGESMTEYSGKLAVGADGIWSRIRTECLKLPAPKYSGMSAIRALIPTTQFEPGPVHANTTVWFGKGAHVVTYPVRGSSYINVVAVLTQKEGERNASLERTELLDTFSSWSDPVLALFEKQARWTSWPIYEIEKVEGFASGPVALVGDAAHPMLPFAAQGAAMAIEDAAVLANLLTGDRDVAAGVAAYESARMIRVRRVMKTSQANGQIYHMGKMGSRFRNLIMQMSPGRRLLDRQAWIYNWRPSFPLTDTKPVG